MHEAIQEVVYQHRNVFRSFPERRHVKGHDIEAIEEIFSKKVVLDLCSEVLIRGGNNSDVNLDASRVTKRSDFLVLQHP